MGSGGRAASDSRNATRINTELFRSYGGAGQAILRPTQAFIRGALDVGEPQYVGRAYDQARAAAGEGAQAATRAMRGQMGGREGGALLRGVAAAQGAGGRAFVDERSAVSAGQAVNQVEQRNQLLKLLTGQGAQATNLATGFGSLGLQGVGMGLNAGNPFYEATVGLGSAGAATYLNWLTGRPGMPQVPAGGTVGAATTGYTGRYGPTP